MPEDVSNPDQPTTWEVGQRVTVRHENGNIVTMPATDDRSMTDPSIYLETGAWELWEVQEYPEPLRSRLKGLREGTLPVQMPGLDGILRKGI